MTDYSNWYRSFEVTTAPTVEPVSVTDCKNQLRIDTSSDDTLISGYITAARETLERLMRRSFNTQTITMKLDGFPSGSIQINLPRPPTVSATSVVYVDENGATQTWSSANYTVDVQANPASISPNYDVDYPNTRTQPNNVTVVYVAGYGATAADVPEGIRLAIKMLVGNWYENREALVDHHLRDVPLGIKMLVAAYEMPEVF